MQQATMLPKLFLMVIALAPLVMNLTDQTTVFSAVVTEDLTQEKIAMEESDVL